MVSRRPGAQEVDWAASAKVAAQYGRSFYLASRFLPSQRRRAILATYAYCRTADDIADLATDADLPAAADRLDRWQEELDRPTHPIAIAFAAAREQYAIPTQPVIELLEGVRMDLSITRYPTWADLRVYCHHVAGTVGLMVAPILGCRNGRALGHAAELGIAMQLTNIVRDVGQDAQLGRLYLPLEEVAAFGCTPDEILAGRPSEGFPALLAYQISRARDLYRRAHHGVGALAPSGRVTTLAASALYSGILGEIEAMNYAVFDHRAHLSATRKARALASVVAQCARRRPSGYGPPMSLSAILAESSTPGTPAPGCVPAPTKYRLETSGARLCGRNQADWVRMGSTEKAEP